MAPDDLRSAFDAHVRDFLRARRRALTRRLGLGADDLDDLGQELRLALWLAADRFNPARGRHAAFVATVLDRCVARYLRHRFAGKRDRRRERGDPDAGHHVPEHMPEHTDLRIDLAAVLGSLSPQDRRLAELLGRERPASAARALGVPRSTLAAVIGRLRSRFEAAGLRDYL